MRLVLDNTSIAHWTKLAICATMHTVCDYRSVGFRDRGRYKGGVVQYLPLVAYYTTYYRKHRNIIIDGHIRT